MTIVESIQLIAALVFPLALIVVWANRAHLKKGIGVRIVQFVAASMLVPGVIILALSDKIGGETSAALLGAFIGYLFSNIAKFEDR